jgi:NADH:ubiquinone oxidoreductase subunit E
MTELYDEIQVIADQYPVRRSAIMPALRLAQERHGWLSPQAFRDVAEALELTPAYCKAVASFYDMFHLRPVGEHLVEVCTNISCALVGAQQTLEAFERELGIKAGETTADGAVTLRTVECAALRRDRPPLLRAGQIRPRRRARQRARRGARRGGTDGWRLGTSSSSTPTSAT